MIVTASLTTNVAKVADGAAAVSRLIDELLGLDHSNWESTLYVGDEQFHKSKVSGPFPNHQFRVSVRPAVNAAALHYLDYNDTIMPGAVSWSGLRSTVDLIFNGTTGAVFPRTAVITVADARGALQEWAHTRRRPKCIQWRPYDMY